MATSKHNVRNNAEGPRGINTVDGYRELAPGQTLENVELDAAELKSAKRAGYFHLDGDADADDAADAAAEAGEGLPNNMPKLKSIAKQEGVDIGGLNKVADIQLAILNARAAKASAPPVTPPPADDLDNMADDTLRDTVAAVTGKPVSEFANTDRDELLRLARGQ